MSRIDSPSYAICRFAIVPVRRFADMVGEMTNQVRFGEGVEVLQEERGLWRVRLCHDNYEGWVDSRQFTAPGPDLPVQATMLTAELAGWTAKEELLSSNTRLGGPEKRLLPRGTPLPAYQKDGRFLIGSESWQWQGAAHPIKSELACWQELLREASLYLNTPYMWGGRSLWGIDCSGLVQTLLQHQGVRLSRDCITQIEEGTAVPGLADARPGDLAFFDGTRDGGRHVGFVLEGGKVLHASGYVRIDDLTADGIIVRETGYLSHSLRALRRVAAWEPFGS